jgi:hypothetical protein
LSLLLCHMIATILNYAVEFRRLRYEKKFIRNKSNGIYLHHFGNDLLTFLHEALESILIMLERAIHPRHRFDIGTIKLAPLGADIVAPDEIYKN